MAIVGTRSKRANSNKRNCRKRSNFNQFLHNIWCVAARTRRQLPQPPIGLVVESSMEEQNTLVLTDCRCLEGGVEVGSNHPRSPSALPLCHTVTPLSDTHNHTRPRTHTHTATNGHSTEDTADDTAAAAAVRRHETRTMCIISSSSLCWCCVI